MTKKQLLDIITQTAIDSARVLRESEPNRSGGMYTFTRLTREFLEDADVAVDEDASDYMALIRMQVMGETVSVESIGLGKIVDEDTPDASIWAGKPVIVIDRDFLKTLSV